MALCLNRQGHTERAIQMLNQVIEIEEFNVKARGRKLNYLLESGQIDNVKKELKAIKLQPSCFPEEVRAIARNVEK